VPLLDATLRELVRSAKVLAPAAAGQAMRVRARASHGRNHQITGLELGDGSADFHNLPQRFVTQDQVFTMTGRRSIKEGADFLVGAAQADFEAADFNVVILVDVWVRMIHQSHLALSGKDSERSHIKPLSLTLSPLVGMREPL